MRAAQPSPRTVRDDLADALFALLEDEPFEKVAVAGIARAARVNRSTFYRNASGKQDLVRHRIDRIMDEQLRAFRAGGAYTFRAYMLTVFETFEHHRADLAAIERNGLGDVLLDALADTFERDAGGRELSLEERYRIRFHVGGIYNHLRFWIERGMIDEPELMADFCVKQFAADFRPIRIQTIAG